LGETAVACTVARAVAVACMFSVYTRKHRIRSEDDVGGQARVTIDAASAAMRLDRNEVMHI